MMGPVTSPDAQEYTREQVRLMARRTALLYAAFAQAVVRELGEERGRELVREAVRVYGEACGEAVRRQVEEQGLENTPQNYAQGKDLPEVGWDRAEVALADGSTASVVQSCPIAEVFLERGIPELGRLYCGVDQAKQNAYNPVYEFVHAANVLDGDPYCRFVLRRRACSAAQP